MAQREDAFGGYAGGAEREVRPGPAGSGGSLLKYLQNLLHGDFGVSLKMQKNRDVLSIILEMFPVSAKVGAIALCWAVLVGVPLGCLAAFKRGRLTDSFLRVVCTLGISMPSFVVASILLVVFAGGIQALKIFPTLFDPSQGWKTYVLPCFALGFYPMCYTARQTRSAMLDSLNQEYIKTARAKGLKNGRIIFKHALAQRPDSRYYLSGPPGGVYPVRRLRGGERCFPFPDWEDMLCSPFRTGTIR